MLKIDLGKTAMIFIENAGNLMCPAEFPLGSKGRVAVISVTEGPHMVKKHRHRFLGADLVVINLCTLRPGLKAVPSCKNGIGVDEIATALPAR